MDHGFMLTGEIITDPKLYESQFGPSAGFSVKGDLISDIGLPNGSTSMAPVINGKYKLRDNNIPFYCQKGKRVIIHGTVTSDAKQPSDEFKNLYVDFKQVTVVNTTSVINFAFGSAPVHSVQKAKTGVLYVLMEKKKLVGEKAKTSTAPSYRFYRVWSNDTTQVMDTGGSLFFQGLVLRGIFPLPDGYDKYGPLTQPVFYADSISGYIKKS